MIWLTWRQHRMQALVGGLVLGLLGLYFLLTHPGIERFFHTSGAASCLAIPGRECGGVTSIFNEHYSGIRFLAPLFLVVPPLAALFWGAPLVARELEHGTHRLVWTQSITRRRWIGTKLALVGGATVAAAAVLAGLVTWWSGMFVQASAGRLLPGIFDIEGIVPIAYALFALALGVAVGILIKRTVPAMAVALGGYLAVRAVVTLVARRHYLPPKTLSTSFLSPGPPSGDWTISSVTVDRAGTVIGPGHQLNFNYLGPRCQGLIPPAGRLPSPHNVQACVHKLGLHIVSTYQPANRFWPFQGIESAIYAALAAVLVAISVWVVRRRTA